MGKTDSVSLDTGPGTWRMEREVIQEVVTGVSSNGASTGLGSRLLRK